MNKARILLITGILLCVAGISQAQEADGAKLGIDVDTTFVSKYIWHGFDLLDDKGAFQPSVNVDLWGTGLSVNFWGSIPLSAGYSSSGGFSRVDATELDYTIAYDCTIFDDEAYATDVTTNWIYYDFIDQASRTGDAQEFGLGFSWPNICPFGLVPQLLCRQDMGVEVQLGAYRRLWRLGSRLRAWLRPDCSGPSA